MERKGISRRGVLATVVDKSIESRQGVSRMMDLLAPDSTPQVRNLRALQESEEISQRDMTDAIGGVLSVLPTVYEWVTITSDEFSLDGRITLTLGGHQIEVAHSYSFHNWEQDSEQSSVTFNPDTQNIETVKYFFDSTGENTGRTTSTDFQRFDSSVTVKLTPEEEDAFNDIINEMGYGDVNDRMILEALYQAVVYGNNSTYYDDVIIREHRIFELAEMQSGYYKDILSGRGIDPSFLTEFRFSLEERDIQKVVTTIDKIRRFDAAKYLISKAQRLALQVTSPQLRAIIPDPPDEIREALMRKSSSTNGHTISQSE